MNIFATHPIRAVLWDFDGVLNANAPRGRYLWHASFDAQFGHPVEGLVTRVFSDPDTLLTGAASLSDRIAAWIAATGAATTPQAVIDWWLARDWHPDPQVIALCRAVAKKGLRQAILTNADRDRAAWITGRLPDLPGIEAVHASSLIGAAKPDAAAFAAASAAFDLPPQVILFVDDSSTNVNAAAKLGFQTFRLTSFSLDALRAKIGR